MGRTSRAALAALLLGTACGGSGGPDALPESFDVLVAIHRAAEDEYMERVPPALTALGLNEPRVQAYEYDFLPDKPVFFIGIGGGDADPRALLDAALPLFGGESGFRDEPQPASHETGEYLCGTFDTTGTLNPQWGLNAISGACAWNHSDGAGFTVGTSGVNADDVLRYTGEARAAMSER